MGTQERLKYLKSNSQFQTSLDWDNYFHFHKTHKIEVSKSSGLNFINNFVGCKNCHVGFQIDTYLEGCTHDCKYCYAKIEGELVGKWNSPVPLPLDLTLLWELFHRVLEKKEDHPLKEVIEKRVALRIGSLSDPFLVMDKKLGITEELIKLLNHFNYPYLFFTRSHLVAEEPYLSLMKPELGVIQISIPSLDEERTKKLEPRASSPLKRLWALKVLKEKGFWVTARINPLFPSLPDGSLSGGKTLKDGEFDFFTPKLIEEIAKTGCKSLLTGFVTLKSNLVDELSSVLEFPLRSLMKDKSEGKDFFFSEEEIRQYFIQIKEIAKENNLDFSTCYLGQPEEQYFKNQDLWDNKKDCCNNIDKVPEFKTSSRDLSWEQLIGSEEDHGFLQNLSLKLLRFILKKVKA